MSRRGLVLVAAALALFAAGCGSGETAAPKPETVEGTLPEATTTTTGSTSTGKGNAAAGKKVFVNVAGCGGCHTLKAAGTTGQVGPNLDEKKPELSLIVDRVTNGKSPMPAFKDTLTQQQIDDVAAFVYESTHS